MKYFGYAGHLPKCVTRAGWFFRVLSSHTSWAGRYAGVIGVRRFVKCPAYPKYLPNPFTGRSKRGGYWEMGSGRSTWDSLEIRCVILLTPIYFAKEANVGHRVPMILGPGRNCPGGCDTSPDVVNNAVLLSLF